MYSVAILDKYSDYWHIWHLNEEQLEKLKLHNQHIIMDVIKL